MGHERAHGLGLICVSYTVSFEALCYNLHEIVLWIAQWAMRGPMGWVGSVCPDIVSFLSFVLQFTWDCVVDCTMNWQ